MLADGAEGIDVLLAGAAAVGAEPFCPEVAGVVDSFLPQPANRPAPSTMATAANFRRLLLICILYLFKH
ncbi:hypothetical protein BJI67_13050 [Acidihalobacter aeolianus]|uniref:Uncharacterized protein n=1 Tax=Acidihalobacter aeolianus TaxID=2792603 RepID=A0A1D8KA57_9GAMM|nr:hypothetical protein [Acidihalobacter aeolianus]AOV17858.1 hypothetical protein BJI67_13050 [Acidihalobacter aeolianus]